MTSHLNISAAISYYYTYVIDCDFQIRDVEYTGRLYLCRVKSDVIITERHTGINMLNGQHQLDMNSSSVDAIFAEYHTVSYIPDFTPVTKNLKVFCLTQCDLLSLEQRDLKLYDKLEVLWANGNRLKSLQKDLFIYNPNLKSVNLDLNSINKIDSNIFSNLHNLQSLSLNHNDCLKSVGNGKLSVSEWIAKIELECQKFQDEMIVRPRQMYQRVERKKQDIWTIFGSTFGLFFIAMAAVVVLHNVFKLLRSKRVF